jgi:hypothetical protein
MLHMAEHRTADEILTSLNMPGYFRDALRSENFVVNEDGEMNQVLVGTEHVVKMPRGTPREQAAVTYFEGIVVGSLEDIRTPSPVAVPEYVDASFPRDLPRGMVDKVSWLALSLVPGTVLSRDQVRAFSPEEECDLGTKIGSFVAWLGTGMSPHDYQRTIKFANPVIFDRQLQIEKVTHRATIEDTPDVLTDVLIKLNRERVKRERDGSLRPTLIGHDDLHDQNLTFTRQTGRWALHGVFDFGLTKPSTPERELRHLLTLGPKTAQAGIDAYEDVTGQQVSHELLRFWAIAQAATQYAAAIWNGHERNAAMKRLDLEAILPDRDWSELDKHTAAHHPEAVRRIVSDRLIQHG